MKINLKIRSKKKLMKYAVLIFLFAMFGINSAVARTDSTFYFIFFLALLVVIKFFGLHEEDSSRLGVFSLFCMIFSALIGLETLSETFALTGIMLLGLSIFERVYKVYISKGGEGL